uniref:Uncharacterized protein n=1 Tax=Meloidogyne incognita TaxID=6306 RepID=A0A914MTB9_MELIC
MPAIHFCSIQLNITEDNCCQLIKLLNIPEKIPFCLPKLQENISNNNLEIKNQNHTLEDNNSTFEATSLIFNNISTTLFQITSSPPSVKYGGGAPAMPVMNLKIAPSEAPEEHLTFLFGIFMLISMAVICTLFLMKLAKVNSIQSSTSIIPPRLRFSPRDFARSLAAVDYSLMLCIPRSTSTNSNISNNSKVYNGRRSLNCQSLNQRQRRTQPPLVVLLGSSFKCGNLSNPESLKNSSRKGRSSVSIVSSSSMNILLPQIKNSNSFTSDGRLALLNASTSNNNFSTELTPPPCYEELEELIENNKKE